MSRLDPRLNAYRADLADETLKGKVRADRFVTGKVHHVAASQAPLRRAPSATAALETEALRGEALRVFETRPDGWCWVQLACDRYVGWTERDALSAPGVAATHRVTALRTFAFSEPDIKSAPLSALPLGAEVAMVGEAEDKNARYALIEPAGAVVMQHLSAIDAFATDWTGIAERFVGAPYLWGGKTSLGIDCSGLVQIAFQACGIAAPRDTDMQEAEIGVALPHGNALPSLRRGDLVFWPGHVGFIRDAETLLHANAHAMAVADEPLAAALERFERQGLKPTQVRRVDPRIAIPGSDGL